MHLKLIFSRPVTSADNDVEAGETDQLNGEGEGELDEDIELRVSSFFNLKKQKIISLKIYFLGAKRTGHKCDSSQKSSNNG